MHDAREAARIRHQVAQHHARREDVFAPRELDVDAINRVAWRSTQPEWAINKREAIDDCRALLAHVSALEESLLSASYLLSLMHSPDQQSHSPMEGGDIPMKIQSYIEKPADPKNVKAFQVPDGETVAVQDGAGNTVTAAAGDYVEVDETDAHVQAWAKADFEAKFVLVPDTVTA